MNQGTSPNIDGPVVGLLIPEFPQQTHCAWWRVGNAFKHHGVEMQMLSTRKAEAGKRCHDFLIEQSKTTKYCWPPKLGAVLGYFLTHPGALMKGLGYLLGMRESSFVEKLKAVPLMIGGADLCVYAKRRGLDAIFVHSCANAAHVVALCHAMGGPPYALRLGGDLGVYGKDHRSKMGSVSFIASSAPNYFGDLRDKCGVPDEKLMWTWVGCDLERFTPGDRQWQRQSPDELRAISVARLTDTKGHADVLHAIAIMRDRGVFVRYTLIGAGPEEQNIRDLSDELGIADRIELLGAKSMDEVVEHLRVSDVSILASYGLGESSPAVVAEAMACGVPVVCTRIGATHQMFTDGKEGYLVDQRDPAGLAEALQKMASDETMRQDMAKAALANAPIFDCRDVARRVLNYFDLLDGPRKRSPLSDEQPNESVGVAT